MLFTLWEVVQIAITIAALGFIFSGTFRAPKTESEIDLYTEKPNWFSQFNLEDLKYAAMIAAPAVIFHELGHKFLALSYGFTAIYNASFWGLGLGIVMRLFSPGLLFFIPGYVSMSGIGSTFDFGLVALMGPIINLIIFGICTLALNQGWAPKYDRIFYLSKQINLWLLIFNMLPIPGMDGFQFYRGLYSLL